MSVFVKRALTLAASPSHKLFNFLQFHPFSSSKSTDKSSDWSPFVADYLINSCGFTSERALAASKYIKFTKPDRPDSVLAFFKDKGFTQKQISDLIHCDPNLLICNPHKTLLPKLQFLKSKQISDSDIVAIVSAQPRMLRKNLETGLVESFNFFSSFLQSDQKTAVAFKRLGSLLKVANADFIKTNIEILEKAGVPTKQIGYLVGLQPKILMASQERVRRITEQTTRLGVNPLTVNFAVAVHVLNSISKSTWDKKVEVYKRWGWSENDVVHAFKKFPLCMLLSEDKITSVMEFLVKKMGMPSLMLIDRPILLSMSLENRIVPRCEVYQALVSKGVIRHSDIRLATLLRNSVKDFEEKFMEAHKEAYPELMKRYRQKVGACKSGSPLEVGVLL